MDSTSESKLWALLIGIDKYLPRTEGLRVQLPNLSGCVNDVRRVEQFLTRLGVDETRLLKLTATDAGDVLPTEDANTLPTYRNIVRDLERIQHAASPGDRVYIHYSGHGIRRDQLHEQTDDGDHFEGTALAPVDVMAGGAYLTGYDLGVRAKNMVEKKDLRVTIVLDSCFSGRGLRGDDGDDDDGAWDGHVRTVNAVDESMLPSDYLAADVAGSLDDMAVSLGDFLFRGARVRSSWLEDPVGCVVISACEPHQRAGEITFGEGHSGLLSHWMLECLQSYPVDALPSTAKVVEIVTRAIRAMPTRNLAQTPIIHGESTYEFLGLRAILRRTTSSVLRSRTSNVVELDIGKAHAVAIGAVYQIFPETWESEGDQASASGTAAPLYVRVEKVDTFRAWARIISDSDRDLIGQERMIVSGSRAVLQTWSLAHCDIGTDSVSTTLKSAFRDELRRVFSLGIGTNPVSMLNVHSDPDESIWISDPESTRELDGYLPLTSVQRLQRKDEDREHAVQRLAYIISHIMRYRTILELRNSDFLSGLTAAFSFEPLDAYQRPLSKNRDGFYEVCDGDDVIVSFTNKLVTPKLYLTLLCLDSSWAITRLYPSGAQVSEVLPKGTTSIAMTMQIPTPPEGAKQPQFTSDVVRACVYLGEHPISWDELLLPELITVAGKNWHRPGVEPVSDHIDSRLAIRPRLIRTGPSTDTRDKWAFLDIHLRIYAAGQS